MKAKIENENYYYAYDTDTGRIKLLPVSEIFAHKKPWTVTGLPKPKRFRTHAEAIHHAHKNARKGKK